MAQMDVKYIVSSNIHEINDESVSTVIRTHISAGKQHDTHVWLFPWFYGKDIHVNGVHFVFYPFYINDTDRA